MQSSFFENERSAGLKTYRWGRAPGPAFAASRSADAASSTAARWRPMRAIGLTIDGARVQVETGSTVLGACQMAGIRVPTLCFDPDLDPFGGCRLCSVKIEGMRGLPLACTTEAAEGMRVITEDEEILAARRMIVRLLLADHPKDCLGCPANLNCELQELAYEFGVRDHGMLPLQRQGVVDESSPVFLWDMKRCVLCARCVRTCEEIVGLGAIQLVQRGVETHVAAFLGDEIASSICESCGECVVHCPTGALSFREVTLRPELEVRTICPFCGTGCGVLVGVRRGEGGRGRGDR